MALLPRQLRPPVERAEALLLAVRLALEVEQPAEAEHWQSEGWPFVVTVPIRKNLQALPK